LLDEPSADLHIFSDISEAFSALVNIPIYTYIYLYALVAMTVPRYIVYYHCEDQNASRQNLFLCSTSLTSPVPSTVHTLKYSGCGTN